MLVRRRVFEFDRMMEKRKEIDVKFDRKNFFLEARCDNAIHEPRDISRFDSGRNPSTLFAQNGGGL